MVRVSPAASAALVIVLAIAPAPPAAAQPRRAPPRGVDALADWLSLPVLRDGEALRFSSSDPTGGDADLIVPGESRVARLVLAEVNGPGCVTRIWCQSPTGTFRLFLDGDREPRLECPFPDLFQNRFPPFLPPLSGSAGGGSFSLVPIPFRGSCRIEVETGAPLEYHVDVTRYPDALRLATFQTALSRVEKESLDRALLFLRRPGEPPFHADPGDRVASGRSDVAPGESLSLFEDRGAGIVLSLRLRVEPLTPDVLRGAVLSARWDGEAAPSVLVPLGDFFGCAFGATPYRSLPLGLASDGVFYCHFPMPFARGARIDVVNDGPEPLRLVEWEVTHHRRTTAEAAGSGTFHARFNRETARAGIPVTILEASGSGHLVGCALAIQGLPGVEFHGGDERIFVDGSSVPAVVGTSTPGFFSAGSAFSAGAFAGPLHGVVTFDAPVGRVAAYRFLIADAVPFRRSIRVELEHGGRNDAEGTDYAATAYFYQRGPNPEGVEVPAFSDRRLRPIRVADAIEAEEIGLSRGQGAMPVPLAEAGFPGEFSGGRTVSFDGPEPGDGFEIVVPVREAGVVAVVAGIATAPDGGRYRVTAPDGSPAAEVSFRSESPASRVETELFRLRASGSGVLPLRFTSLGATAESPGSRLRLDYVRLVPPRREDRAIEAESLAVTGSKPCLVEDIRLGWSGGSQVRMDADGPGDAMEFSLEVPVGADYAIEWRPTVGPSYAEIAATAGGSPGGRFDAWGEVESTGPWVAFPASVFFHSGRHAIRFEVAGANAKSTGHSIGIDAIRLRRASTPALVEAETLRASRIAKGSIEIRSMARAGPFFSGDTDIRFVGAGPGASFELDVPVPETGLYSVGLWFTLEPGGAAVQLEIDGTALGAPFDTSGERLAPAERYAAGTRHLRAGTHRFKFSVTSASGTGTAIGLDAIDLAPAGRER